MRLGPPVLRDDLQVIALYITGGPTLSC
jgi:hypothetical protein